MMTPLAPPFGTVSSAVTECDLFLSVSTHASLTRMPGNRSCVLPLMSCGRPAMSGLMRSKPRSSSGTTLYFTASISHSRCSSASFCGFFFARFFACVQSSGP